LVNQQPKPATEPAVRSSSAVERVLLTTTPLVTATTEKSALDPYARMLAQRKALAAFRKAHPNMSTDEVFRSITLSNPQLMKD
jgi:hypothetical protein